MKETMETVTSSKLSDPKLKPEILQNEKIKIKRQTKSQDPFIPLLFLMHATKTLVSRTRPFKRWSYSRRKTHLRPDTFATGRKIQARLNLASCFRSQSSKSACSTIRSLVFVRYFFLGACNLHSQCDHARMQLRPLAIRNCVLHLLCDHPFIVLLTNSRARKNCLFFMVQGALLLYNETNSFFGFNTRYKTKSCCLCFGAVHFCCTCCRIGQKSINRFVPFLTNLPNWDLYHPCSFLPFQFLIFFHVENLKTKRFTSSINLLSQNKNSEKDYLFLIFEYRFLFRRAVFNARAQRKSKW